MNGGERAGPSQGLSWPQPRRRISVCTKQSLKLANDSIVSLHVKNIDLDNKSSQLESSNKGLKDHLFEQECQSRRDYLFFDVISEAEGKTWEECMQNILQFLHTEINTDNTDSIEIVRCHHLLPKQRTTNRARTVDCQISLVWRRWKHVGKSPEAEG